MCGPETLPLTVGWCHVLVILASTMSQLVTLDTTLQISVQPLGFSRHPPVNPVAQRES
jgi:hypothetical protein